MLSLPILRIIFSKDGTSSSKISTQYLGEHHELDFLCGYKACLGMYWAQGVEEETN